MANAHGSRMAPPVPPDGLSIPPRIVDGDFAGWLRHEMAERGMTTRGLAMRTGVHHSIISRLMRGDRDPSLPTAVALLRVLGPEPLRLARHSGSASCLSRLRKHAGEDAEPL